MGTFTSESSHTLFGRTRREVLGLLLGHPDERFYLREILRAIGGGSGALQRELSQLVGAGLVHRVRDGHQVYFSANRNAAIFPELQAIIQKTAGTVELLRAALSPLVQKQRVVVAFVYGSVARGEQTASSDVDLLLLGNATLTEVVSAVRTAEDRLGREVNPSVYPIEEFRKKLRAGAPFLKRVLAGPKLFIAGGDHELARLAG